AAARSAGAGAGGRWVWAWVLAAATAASYDGRWAPRRVVNSSMVTWLCAPRRPVRRWRLRTYVSVVLPPTLNIPSFMIPSEMTLTLKVLPRGWANRLRTSASSVNRRMTAASPRSVLWPAYSVSRGLKTFMGKPVQNSAIRSAGAVRARSIMAQAVGSSRILVLVRPKSRCANVALTSWAGVGLSVLKRTRARLAMDSAAVSRNLYEAVTIPASSAAYPVSDTRTGVG